MTTNELTIEQTEQAARTAAYVKALREVADWYDQHPLANTPYGADISVYNFDATPSEIKAIGKAKKEYGENLFNYIVELETAKIRFVATRDQVCERKVVGFRDIPEEYVPAQTIPARREEIVEWECRESLLKEEA